MKINLDFKKMGKAQFGLGFLVVFFICFFSWFTLRKFEHGMWCGYDQTLWCQVLWTTLHGKLMWGSFLGINGLCHLAEHVTLTILLWLPLYFIFPFPATLSIVQVFLLGTSAVIVYLIAKDKIDSGAALMFTLFYLTNNFIIQAVIEGFQTRTMTVPFCFFAFYFLFKKQYFWFSVFLFLLALSHGIGCLIVCMFGLYLVFAQRELFLGALIFILSLAWFFISIKIIQPHLGLAEPLGALHFVAGGKILSSPADIMQYCFAHPIIVFKEMFTDTKFDYLLRLFLPLGFLPLFSPQELLVGLPVFLQNFALSKHLIGIEIPRYTMLLIPALFISSINSVSYLCKKWRRARIYIFALLFISWAFSTYKFIWDPSYNPRFLQVLSRVPDELRVHRKALQIISKLVPANASVCADMKAMPFLANRFELYDMPFHIKESDYLLIDTKDPVFSPKPTLSLGQCFKIVNNELRSPNYTIVKFKDKIILLKRK
ncbi:MAG: DUF2079 domain-containing protein [Candidatus Omnitrophica bacterium]|nr:DUF2079 domain-containing protein [Candidatus Omnitrophota bacterium]